MCALRSDTHRRAAAALLSKRHVDGSFTSDVNKVLDSMAAKELILWAMNSRPSGERYASVTRQVHRDFFF